jgi:NitT/TauT family transport system ATP-binding protein
LEHKKIVEIKNASIKYHTLEGETEAIKDITLDIHEGETVAIVGPSGCGKSTLLSLISGLIMPSSGQIKILGEKVLGPRRDIGYMFQMDHLFEWRTILKNVLLGLEIQNKLSPENIQYGKELLKKYGLGDFENYFPNQLSGGMRQRVALIRTLAIKPEILLLDEPFSALDYQTRLNVSDEIGSILKRENKTAIMVTHDISEALSMADRVVVLSKRPATIKSIHKINLDCDGDRSPLKCREAPEFRVYFNRIWKELDYNEIK